MEQRNNPAQRLLSLIAAFNTDPNRANSTATSFQIWKSVLDLQDDQIICGIQEILNLISQIESKVNCDSGIANKKLHLRWIGPIRNTFLPSALGREHTFVSHTYQVEGATITSLEACEEALSKSSVEVEISDNDLSALLKACQELFQEISLKVVDPKLREFLLHLVLAIQDGISSYQICGVQGIDTALDTVLGRLVRHGKNDNQVGEADKPYFQRVLTLFKHAADVSDKANKLKTGVLLSYQGIKEIGKLITGSQGS
jgi:hypothetical protein